MFYKNCFSAIASEEIRNYSICVYDHILQTVSNIKGHKDFIGRLGCSFVYVNQVFPVNHDGEEIIKSGEYVRCAVVNITMA